MLLDGRVERRCFGPIPLLRGRLWQHRLRRSTAPAYALRPWVVATVVQPPEMNSNCFPKVNRGFQGYVAIVPKDQQVNSPPVPHFLAFLAGSQERSWTCRNPMLGGLLLICSEPAGMFHGSRAFLEQRQRASSFWYRLRLFPSEPARELDTRGSLDVPSAISRRY